MKFPIIAVAIFLLTGCTVAAPEPIATVNRHENAVHPRLCKDFVDAKARTLHASGIPYSDMTILYGRTTDLQQHVVLEVRYLGQTYVLDNRHDYITSDTDIAVQLRFVPASSEWAYVLSGPHYPGGGL